MIRPVNSVGVSMPICANESEKFDALLGNLFPRSSPPLYAINRLQALTFDCYGTLIDWESGMTAAYRWLVARCGKSLARDQILETHARYEAHQEAKTPMMPYSELLGVVHSMVAREWGLETTIDEDIKFGSSVPDWPAFADSADALRYLKAHYKLVILSNVDRESFKGSHARLQVEFDHIFTAQDIGSYKPDQRNFDYMIAKLAAEGIRKKEILHTAESLFHDHLPANKAGLASAWIYRRHGQQGFGATQPSGAMPRYDFQFTSIGRNDAGAPGGFARERLIRHIQKENFWG
jgi:2-haloacid dehalogenase